MQQHKLPGNMHPDISQQVRIKQAQQKRHHDQHAREIEFVEGRVMVRNFRPGATWIPATITCQQGPLTSNVVVENGQVWKGIRKLEATNVKRTLILMLVFQISLWLHMLLRNQQLLMWNSHLPVNHLLQTQLAIHDEIDLQTDIVNEQLWELLILWGRSVVYAFICIIYPMHVFLCKLYMCR